MDRVDGDVTQPSKIDFMTSRNLLFVEVPQSRLTSEPCFLISQTSLRVLAWSEVNLEQPGNI